MTSPNDLLMRALADVSRLQAQVDAVRRWLAENQGVIGYKAKDQLGAILDAGVVGNPTADDRVEQNPCYQRGPRIGADGVPYCFRPKAHQGDHKAHESWDRAGIPTVWTTRPVADTETPTNDA